MEIKSIQFNDNTWFIPNVNEKLDYDVKGSLPDLLSINGIWITVDGDVRGVFNMDSIKYVKFKKKDEPMKCDHWDVQEDK